MNNKLIRLSVSLLSALSLVSCSGGTTPSVSSQPSSAASVFVQDASAKVFPLHTRGAGCVGDPMPYYENGKAYVFFLEDARNYSGGFHPISLLESSDMVHYEDKGVMLDFVPNRSSIENALATGSVVKDKQGKYHFFYGGYNTATRWTGVPYAQTVLHATSDDLHTWTKDPTFNETGYLIGDNNDFRDPYVFYMEEEDLYWMLIFTRESGTATVAKYTSPDLLHWTKGTNLFKNARFNSMECPSLIKYKGYWYYSFSENGDHGYTKFFAKQNLSDSAWIEIPTLDGFYAGRPIVDKDDRMLLYGWAPTKGLYDSVKGDWAGNLIVTSLVQQNGSAQLRPAMPKEFKDFYNHEVEYTKVLDGKPFTELEFQHTAYPAGIAVNKLKEDVTTRVSFDVTPKEKQGRAGLTFANESNNQLGSIAFDFNFQGNQLRFYNACKDGNYGAIEYVVAIEFEANKTYHVDMITESAVTSVYINNEAALTMRTTSVKRNAWAFYAQEEEVSFTNIHFYE